jgi:hypothetical protein
MEELQTDTLPEGQEASCYPNYPYIPALRKELREIRLLRLLPGPPNAKICCEVDVVSLNDKLVYEALSYVWGNAGETRNISLGGYAFGVTVNLEQALRHLRLVDKERVLWIDALCINQACKKEKESQIQEMRTIYHSAHQVLAWTGEADDESNEALGLLNRLSDPMVCVILYMLSQNSEALRRISFGPEWLKLLNFFNRPYWSRVWILQELAIPGASIRDNWESTKIQVGVGKTWVPISRFNLALMSFGLIQRSLFSSPGYLALPKSSILPKSSGALMMFEVAQSCIRCSSKRRKSIGTLLRMTHFLRATDPLDKVYALRALARDEDHVIYPDYSMSKMQVLRNLVRHLIDVDKNLAILSGNRRLPLNHSGEWSSWVLDPETFIHTTRSDWQPDTTRFEAWTSAAPDVTFSDDLSLLTVKGIVVGTIDIVIGTADWETFPGLTSKELPQSAVMKCLLQLEQFGSSLSESKREAFWRTLVLDSEELKHGRRVYPAPRKIGDWFETMVSNYSASGEAEVSHARRKFYEQVGITQRCFYTTSDGRMGVGPFDTRHGDLVTMLQGGQFCYILREAGDHYLLVGDSYLHGAMHGEIQKSGGKRMECSIEKNFVLR